MIDEENDSILSFEVKTDRSSRRTNNLCIEYNNGFGRPSRIEITKANYHIITDEIDYYLISTEKLKDIIANGNWMKRATYQKMLTNDRARTVNKITSHGYMIPKDVITKQARKIN